MTVQIIYTDPGGPGYHPVFYMAQLASVLFEAELVVLRPDSLNRSQKFGGLFPRQRGELDGILICARPAHLASLLGIKGWRKKYNRLVAWIFDSFWTTDVSCFIRPSHIFDHIFVTELEDLESWSRNMRKPVGWLPWGTDAFKLGSNSAERSLDVLRFGRQPPDWEDDVASAQECERWGMRFQGRPPELRDASESERSLMNILGRTKFTLSFSNSVSPSTQTHPRRQYLTGRWTDALAAGAIVAGIPPRSETVKKLLWDEALLDLDTVSRREGLALIAKSAKEWTPRRAQLNHLRALERLDWRWRFKKLADTLGIQPRTLDQELVSLHGLIHHHTLLLASKEA